MTSNNPPATASPAKRMALVDHFGKPPYKLPIIFEDEIGFTLRTGLNDSPAKEWFAKSCTHGKVIEITEEL
jgi:hypothetical protein